LAAGEAAAAELTGVDVGTPENAGETKPAAAGTCTPGSTASGSAPGTPVAFSCLTRLTGATTPDGGLDRLPLR
jgi:hypothetical protein